MDQVTFDFGWNMYPRIHALNAMTAIERFHVQLSIWHCCFWMNRTERVPLVKSWFHLRFPHAYPNQPGSTLISVIISDTLLNIWCTKPIQTLIKKKRWIGCCAILTEDECCVDVKSSIQCFLLLNYPVINVAHWVYIVDQTIQSNNILTPISMNEYCILIVDTRYSMLIGFSRSTTKLESGGCKCRVATDSRGGNMTSLKWT